MNAESIAGALGAAATWYGAHGLPVFPLAPRSKVPPKGSHGFLDATCDQERIKTWWYETPDANIGLALTESSGLLAVDLDPRNGAPTERADFVAEYGPVPDTAEARTGGGGRHFLFRHPGGELPETIGPGIDIKYNGYIVVAPSIHPDTGRRYEWNGERGVESLLSVADCPTWLLARFKAGSNGKGRGHAATIPQTIPDGEKHAACTRMAGAMRRQGATADEIFAALLELSKRFETAVPANNLRDIAEDIEGRYAPAAAEYPHTELGNAERLVARHGANIRYCPDWRSWLIWDGVRWKRDEIGEIMQRAKEVVRSIYAEAAKVRDSEERKAAATWARKSETGAQLVSMVRLAQSEARVPVMAAELDADHFRLNVINGTVNLRTGELEPHRREDLISKLAPVAYDPSAKCPRWERFLSEIFKPHPDIVPFIQRAVGYSLTGDTREECLFLLHGGGRNGKGTLLKILCIKLGDYAGTADFSAFVQRRDDSGPRDDVANMRGKRLIMAQEAREGAALAESLIKWLTGGDRVRARRLFENSSEFDPTHKIWLATNHKPAIRGTDPAIWSRIKLVPFDVSFLGREDRTLKVVLQDELPGILAWAVEGCLRWQEDGLDFPESVTIATEEYRVESDSIGRFVDEHCVVGEFAQAKARNLYAAYRQWAEGAGEHPMTETAFGRRLAERGYEKGRVLGGLFYRGVGVRGASEA